MDETVYSLGKTVGVSDAEIVGLLVQKNFFASWRITFENQEFSASPSINRLFGHADEAREFAVTDIFEPVHPEDRERVQFEMRQAAINGGDFTVRYRISDGEGRYRAAYSQGRMVQHPEDGRSMIGITCVFPVDARAVGYVESRETQLADALV